MKYFLYGLVLESEEAMAELEPLGFVGQEYETTIALQTSREGPSEAALADALLLPEPTEGIPFVWRAAGGYYLSFSDNIDFWVARDGLTIRRFESDVPFSTANHWLLDHVLPRALDLLEKNPLHATAISTGSRVLAFMGPTGTGKSTVAAALGKAGCELVSDDCLLLRETEGATLATPSYPGLRLYGDVQENLFPLASHAAVAHYTEKRRVLDGMPFAKGELPLATFYVLERHTRPEAPSFERLAPAEATMALAGSVFRMDVERRDQNVRQLKFFARLATRVPVFRCSYSEDLERLSELSAAILRV